MIDRKNLKNHEKILLEMIDREVNLWLKDIKEWKINTTEEVLIFLEKELNKKIKIEKNFTFNNKNIWAIA